MKSPFWLNLLWFATSLGSLLLGITILRLRLLRSWPSLFALSCQDVIWTVVQLHEHHHYKHYFYIFWIGSGLRSLLGIMLIADVLRAVPLSFTVLKKIRVLMFALCVSAGGTAWLMSWSSLPNASPAKHILDTVLLLNRCVQISWAAFLLTLLGLMFTTGLGWGITTIRIATGYLVALGSHVLTSYSFSFMQDPARRVADGADHVVTLWTLCYWIYSLRLCGMSPQAEIRALAEGLTAEPSISNVC